MKIVFVCSGNTCRSPFAEGYFNSLNIKSISAESRGLSLGGTPVSNNSALIAREYGFNIDSHISKPFSKEDFNADYIFAMSESHREFLINNGGNKDKIFVLGGGIKDPFGGDLDYYRHCLSMIKSEIDNLYFGGFFDNITVNNMVYDDIPRIAELEKLNFSEPWSEKSLSESSQNNTVFFVAKKENKLIGYVGLNFILDEGYITSIAVDSKSRNKGIATKLLNKCFCFALEKNLSFISLEVRASNEQAKKLYENLNFKEEGLRKNFYRIPTEDAIIMTRRFNLENADTCY